MCTHVSKARPKHSKVLSMWRSVLTPNLCSIELGFRCSADMWSVLQMISQSYLKAGFNCTAERGVQLETHLKMLKRVKWLQG